MQSLLNKAKKISIKPAKYGKSAIKADRKHQERMELAIAYANREVTNYQVMKALKKKSPSSAHQTLGSTILRGLRDGSIEIKKRK